MSGSLEDAPLGVFDSGLGGLTVVRALRAALPHEDIVYLGDTARVPYGTKGEATVVRYALGCARRLVEHRVKALVIACNTVSAVAPERLRVELDLPVLGVIEPGARAAVAHSRSGRVGVLATAATVASGAYPRAVSALSTRAETTQQAAPLLVPLAEEGWTTGDVPALAVRRYLAPLEAAGVDVVVLGCTHYPLLAPVLDRAARAVAGHAVAIVDSASAMAEAARAALHAPGDNRRGAPGTLRCFATDTSRLDEIAPRFLGEPVDRFELVDL